MADPLDQESPTAIIRRGLGANSFKSLSLHQSLQPLLLLLFSRISRLEFWSGCLPFTRYFFDAQQQPSGRPRHYILCRSALRCWESSSALLASLSGRSLPVTSITTILVEKILCQMSMAVRPDIKTIARPLASHPWSSVDSGVLGTR